MVQVFCTQLVIFLIPWVTWLISCISWIASQFVSTQVNVIKDYHRLIWHFYFVHLFGQFLEGTCCVHVIATHLLNWASCPCVCYQQIQTPKKMSYWQYNIHVRMKFTYVKWTINMTQAITNENHPSMVLSHIYFPQSWYIFRSITQAFSCSYFVLYDIYRVSNSNVFDVCWNLILDATEVANIIRSMGMWKPFYFETQIIGNRFIFYHKCG